jgi:hypothetical protein
MTNGVDSLSKENYRISEKNRYFAQVIVQVAKFFSV